MTAAVPAADAYGGVLIDPSGRVLLREPTGHFGGYAWTYAKGRPDPGESPSDAALREVREETGYAARITAVVPGVFAGTTTTTVMFLMEPVARVQEPDHETRDVRWFEVDEAILRIGLTNTASGRARDLAILEAALTVWRNAPAARGA